MYVSFMEQVKSKVRFRFVGGRTIEVGNKQEFMQHLASLHEFGLPAIRRKTFRRKGNNMPKIELMNIALEIIGKAGFDETSELLRACKERVRELEIVERNELLDAQIEKARAEEEITFHTATLENMRLDMAEDGVKPLPEEDPQIEADIAAQPAPSKRPALSPAAHNVLAKGAARKPGKESKVIPISAARKARKK